jgi:hypothetical protein
MGGRYDTKDLEIAETRHKTLRKEQHELEEENDGGNC